MTKDDNGVWLSAIVGVAESEEGQTLSLSAGEWWACTWPALHTSTGRAICCYEIPKECPQCPAPTTFGKAVEQEKTHYLHTPASHASLWDFHPHSLCSPRATTTLGALLLSIATHSHLILCRGWFQRPNVLCSPRPGHVATTHQSCACAHALARGQSTVLGTLGHYRTKQQWLTVTTTTTRQPVRALHRHSVLSVAWGYHHLIPQTRTHAEPLPAHGGGGGAGGSCRWHRAWCGAGAAWVFAGADWVGAELQRRGKGGESTSRDTA